jgi:hypothetical protein
MHDSWKHSPRLASSSNCLGAIALLGDRAGLQGLGEGSGGSVAGLGSCTAQASPIPPQLRKHHSLSSATQNRNCSQETEVSCPTSEKECGKTVTQARVPNP